MLTSIPAGAVGTRPDINYFSADLVRPRVHSVDVAVERHIGAGITVSASYLYSKGLNLPFFRDINFSPANSTVNYVLDGQSMGSFPLYRGTRPNTDFKRIIVMEPEVTTHYNALVLEAKKRFSAGLLFNLNYTLAKAEDNGQTSATFFGGNLPYDSLTSRANTVDSVFAPSNNDRRHRFVGSFFFQPSYLWGIGVGGVLTLESGLPLTQRINGIAAGGGWARSSHRHQRHRRVFVAPWVGFNTDRQTGRKTFDLRIAKDVRGRRHQPLPGAVGDVQRLQRGELRDLLRFRLRRRRGDHRVQRRDQRRDGEPDPQHRLPRAAHGQQQLLGHARHAVGHQVHVLGEFSGKSPKEARKSGSRDRYASRALDRASR